MNKQEFLAQLRKGLSTLPKEDVEEHLTFYDEMIDDRMEEGLTEEDAVHSIGSLDALIGQIMIECAKTKRNKRLTAWEIVLLLLGSPIWLSLLAAALTVVLSLYAAAWSVIASLWAVFVSVLCSAVCVVLSGAVLTFSGSIPTGLAAFGAGAFCAGLSIFLFFGCNAVTRGTLQLTKKVFFAIKHRFAKKEAAQ